MIDDTEVKGNIAANNDENKVGVVEIKDASTNATKENTTGSEAETDIEIISGLIAAAGIVTNIENYESKRTQRRHYSEADEDVIINENAVAKDESDVEKIEFVSAAGIETKIENYENKRTQRRHFSEADEEIDVSIENLDERMEEFAPEFNEEEPTKTEDIALVERKIEDCKGGRKHFPGTTTSNIFR